MNTPKTKASLNAERVALILLLLLGIVGIALFCVKWLDAPPEFTTVFVVLFGAIGLLSCTSLKWKLDLSGSSIAFAIICGCCFVFGSELDLVGYLHDVGLTVLEIALLSAYAYVVCLAGLQLAKRWQEGDDTRRSATRKRWVLVACFAVIAVDYLAWYLVMFPGMYGYDGAFWLHQYMDPNEPITTHWSVPYTFAFYAVVSFGTTVFGSASGGFALFAFLQLLVVLYAIYKVLSFVWKRCPAKWAIVVATAFYAIMPAFPILAVSSAQDALFMAFFSLIVVHVARMMLDPARYFARGRKLVELAVLVLLFCLVRNNGMYALVLALPFLLAWKDHRGKVALALVVPIAISLIIQGPLLDRMGVEKDDTLRSMLSVPIMQIARAYNYGADLPQDCQQEIKAYISDDSLAIYTLNQEISDGIFAGTNMARIHEDIPRFAALYGELGVRYPQLYAEAAGLLSMGVWYPLKKYPDTRMYHPWIESECIDAAAINPDYVVIESASFFPEVDRVVNNLFGGGQTHANRGDQAFSEVFPYSILMKAGWYFLLLLFLLAFIFETRQWRALFLWMLFGGLLATILLAPVALCRYVAPIMFACPVLILAVINYHSADYHQKLEQQDDQQSNQEDQADRQDVVSTL